MGKSIGRALNIIDGLSGALGLGTALASVTTPDLKGLGMGLSQGLGERLSRALDLVGGIGGTLVHVAALAGVTAPDGNVGDLGLLRFRHGSGLDGRSSQKSDSGGEVLHFEEWSELIDGRRGLD